MKDEYVFYISIIVIVVLVAVGVYLVALPQTNNYSTIVDGSSHVANVTTGLNWFKPYCHVNNLTVFTSVNGNLSQKNAFGNKIDLNMILSNNPMLPNTCVYK